MKNKEKEWDFGLMFLGLGMGAILNLFAAIVDRRFSHFGIPYEFVVVVATLGIVWWVERRFKKILEQH